MAERLNKTGLARLWQAIQVHVSQEVSDVAADVSGKAPTSHASSSTTYGIGTTSNYGHVKLSDNNSSGVAVGVDTFEADLLSKLTVLNLDPQQTDVFNIDDAAIEKLNILVYGSNINSITGTLPSTSFSYGTWSFRFLEVVGDETSPSTIIQKLTAICVQSNMLGHKYIDDYHSWERVVKISSGGSSIDTNNTTDWYEIPDATGVLF